MIGTIGLAVALFASTNVDDTFVLMAFFADPRFTTTQIVLGQYLGIFALVLVSVLVSLVSLMLSREQVGLLGLVPVLIGLKRLYDLRRGADTDGGTARTGAGAVLAVAAVTMANGGDNIGVYAPVFATRSAADVATMALVFAGLTALWLGFGHGLMNHPWIGAPIRRYGHRVVPFMLIGIGVVILCEGGSAHLLERL